MRFTTGLLVGAGLTLVGVCFIMGASANIIRERPQIVFPMRRVG